MLVEVRVPQLSESVSEATLLTWHKKPGEYVQRDENLIDIETDKVVLELPAPESGVLTRIDKPDGGTVVSNELIATIDTEARATAQPAAAKGAEKPAAPVAAVAAPTPVKAPSSASAGSHGTESIVMPAARKLAAEKNVDLAAIQGSGRGGRITKEDVVAQIARPASKPAPVAPPVDVGQLLGDRPEQRVPMSRLRQRVAERLVQSQSTAAILTTFNEVNMQPVMEMRKKYQERFEKEHGVRLGFMSFFVKAAVHALRKYPLVNASVDGNDIVYHGYFDIGIAVGSPRGLVVPILRNADQMSLADIEKQIADFGKRAQDGKLSIEELTGGTFSISNGGVFGSMLSTPIINPPQSAILGVHATKERPVVENGQIVIRPMNYLALSYDHRIIDGREAVLSLVAMKDALEDPARLLLDI
ncbi:MAG: 2-oxoglutarate dehydrogenase complex dihydrolipoyllysine-residue succinyltransferase [Burkholderiales bacterium]|nr:2-oxoglutarate dehydrogenase complex dihydrolipoyllysine-residue succinyltransferase [Burkholderiales bacterium]